MTDQDWPFEICVGRAYIRAVFARFEDTLKKATAFKITQDPARGQNSWLIQHTNRSNKIVWGQHQFHVTVDEDKEVFECECKQLEHTGMVSQSPRPLPFFITSHIIART